MDGLPYYLTFTKNVSRYWSDTTPPFNGYFLHTWSLALEVQFYLLWPVVVLLAGRKRLIPLALLLVAIAALSRSPRSALVAARRAVRRLRPRGPSRMHFLRFSSGGPEMAS